VTYDEGLCSSKAIVFISAKSICNRVNSTLLSYLVLGTIPLQNVLSKQILFRCISKNLGEKNYG